ncbi:MAG: O-mycaminosyltylonolide 6-deoxyallosyltransferase [Phycisphaerales bacterium]|nr:O-mycaminosyltylonolide 6-deoxyallosyltransferase [Phycisphaerales bacterium]
MRVLMMTIGSGGDVHPFIGVGLRLAARGHEVRLATNPHFEARIKAAGLGFEPLGTEAEFMQVLTDPRLVRQNASPKLIIDELIHKSVEPTVELTQRVVTEWKPDVIVRHHISLGSRWVAQRHGIPTATIVLAPAFFFSRQDAGVYRSWERLGSPRWLAELRLRIGKYAMRWFMDRPLNAIRRRLGFEPGRDFLFGEVKDGDVTLGLWSKHLRGPAPDDPAHSHVCGYSFFDRSPTDEQDLNELDSFVGRCEESGRPPVVFTLGTSVVQHAGNFYHIAAEACRMLDRPAVLLVGKPENAPTGLPASIRAFPYAPFSTLLPRAAATVHHGGAGTTGQGLRSGRPTVIIPFVNDEFDNAARAERLGTSITLGRRKLNARSIASCLDRAIHDREMKMRADVLGGALRVEDGAEDAAERIEAVVKLR